MEATFVRTNPAYASISCCFYRRYDYLTVYPCCLANNGTAIKLAIEFDERLKENVGLKFNLDIDYIRRNPKPSADFLKENLVTEAIVSFLTSIDNKCSLPCAIEYSTKSGKTTEACHNMLIEQVKILQTCQSCQSRALSSHLENALNIAKAFARPALT